MSPGQLVSVLFVYLGCCKVHGAVSCIGENGQPVDWFIVYKLPELRDSQHVHVVEGLGYAYMDPTTSQQFTMSDKSIRNTSSAVGHTLQQIYTSYQRDGDVAFLMYNDEDPNGKESLSKGHTKGDVAFDTTSGFWLIHSAPAFPPFAKDSYNYPESGTRFGQSFLCVTFELASFNDIGLQLLYNGPAIFDHGGPDSLIDNVTNIRKAIDGQFILTEPYYHIAKLSSLNDIAFISFAKSKKFDRDLYHDLVAPHYNTSLLTETWQNGRGKLPSNCSVPTVENVEQLVVDQQAFHETKDHSKWTISKYSSLKLACIGDINRMEAQFKRGGGTLCIQNTDIWGTFHDTITLIAKCQKENLWNSNIIK